MTTLALTTTALIATTQGRSVVIQRVTATERFAALRRLGASEAVAQALMAGLVTMKVKVA